MSELHARENHTQLNDLVSRCPKTLYRRVVVKYLLWMRTMLTQC